MSQKANFTAGPGIVPEPVMERLRAAMIDFEGTGVPIVSTSHRHKKMEEACEKARALAKELLKVPDGYTIVFCPGGAQSQFKTWVLNMKPDPEREDGKNIIGCIDSGYWSNMAIKAMRELETAGICRVRVLASSEEDKHRSMPGKVSAFWVEGGLDFLYFTSNETINGTQACLDVRTDHWGIDIVADMTSDIMSRPVDVKRFGVIFAGPQKNLGVVGAALVIIRDGLLAPAHKTLPFPLSYIEQQKACGAFRNTPDTLSLYSIYCMLEWIKSEGGIDAMERRAIARSSMLYDAIDRSEVFEGIADKKDRSLMNVTFRLRDQSRHPAFIERCEKAGIVGIEGHKQADVLYGPHLRASLYNGQTMENVLRLIQTMHEFEKTR